MRDESYLPDYDFEINEEFRKSAGSMSSGLSSRSRNSTKPTTASSIATSRSDSPESSQSYWPETSANSMEKDASLRIVERSNKYIKPSIDTRLHRAVHPLERLLCPERDCDASFSEEHRWMVHLNAAHDTTREPVCWKHECKGRNFTTVENLFQHQKEMRNADSMYQCLICGATFATESVRDRHISDETCLARSEVPVLQVSRPVSACQQCKRGELRCDGRLPMCTPCAKLGGFPACSYKVDGLFQSTKGSNSILQRSMDKHSNPETKVEDLAKDSAASQPDIEHLGTSIDDVNVEPGYIMEIAPDDMMAFHQIPSAADPSNLKIYYDRFAQEQLAYLERESERTRKPNIEHKKALADKIGVEVSKVTVSCRLTS